MSLASTVHIVLPSLVESVLSDGVDAITIFAAAEVAPAKVKDLVDIVASAANASPPAVGMGNGMISRKARVGARWTWMEGIARLFWVGPFANAGMTE
jgi:hypothetical protein